MKNSSALLLLSLATTAWPVLAAEPDLSKLPPPSAKKGLTYAKDIRPILEETCFRCHGEERQRGKLRLDSLEAALKGGEDGKVISPGDSKKSQLVIAVAQLDDETAMPPKRRPGGGRGGRGGPGGFRGAGAPGKPGEAAKPGSEEGRPPGAPGGPNQSGPRGGAPGKPGGGPGGFGPPPKPLTAEQVGLIRAWIDQGAK